ncbi:MAG: hypothetical protein K2N06_02540 [Oscillospiraceae bacterium]|nr:hypothetical protein [Oscillospiraceae bacterium]
MVDLAQLYDNCVYSSIAHAVFILREPFFAAGQSWDGMNYSFNDFCGTMGTISFDPDGEIMAGAVRDDKSERVRKYPSFKAIQLFENAPDNVKQLARKETLEYLYDERDGITQPMATVAFWSIDGNIVIDEDIDLFRKNGGAYLFTIAVSYDELCSYWREEYHLSDDEASIVEYIYKCFANHEPIKLEQVPIIDQGCAGYEDCITALEEIGIAIEQ